MRRRLLAMLLLWAGMLGQSALALNFLTEENPPLNFTREGQPAGMATAVVTEMATRAKLPASIAVLPWTEAYSRAQGEPDTCVFSTVRLASRNNQFQWVGPIVRGYWSAFALEGFADKIAKVDELKTLRAGVVRDARAEQLRSMGFTRLFESDRDADIPVKLGLDRDKAGAVDIWITQGHSAREIAGKQGLAVKEVFSAIMSQDYWLACNPQMPREQVRAMVGALNEMRKDGTLLKLSRPPN